MNTIRQIHLFTILIILFSCTSCAVHSSFPFICFRSGCVHQQWNMQGLKKRIRAHLAVKKKNRNRHRAVAKKADHSVETGKEELARQSMGLSHFHTRIKFVFYIGTDSLSFRNDSLITGMQDGRKITGLDNEEATAFIANIKKPEIRKVTVCLWDDETQETYRNSHRQRVKYITHYLAAKGVPRSAIVILETPPVNKTLSQR